MPQFQPSHALIDTICWEKNVSIRENFVFLALFFFENLTKKSQKVSIRAWVVYMSYEIIFLSKVAILVENFDAKILAK